MLEYTSIEHEISTIINPESEYHHFKSLSASLYIAGIGEAVTVSTLGGLLVSRHETRNWHNESHYAQELFEAYDGDLKAIYRQITEPTSVCNINTIRGNNLLIIEAIITARPHRRKGAATNLLRMLSHELRDYWPLEIIIDIRPPEYDDSPAKTSLLTKTDITTRQNQLLSWYESIGFKKLNNEADCNCMHMSIGEEPEISHDLSCLIED